MKITSQVQQVLTLEPNDPKSLATLCGQFDEHLRQIEQRLSVDIRNRGNLFEIRGETLAVNAAGAVLKSLYLEALEGVSLKFTASRHRHAAGLIVNNLKRRCTRDIDSH